MNASTTEAHPVLQHGQCLGFSTMHDFVDGLHDGDHGPGLLVHFAGQVQRCCGDDLRTMDSFQSQLQLWQVRRMRTCERLVSYLGAVSSHGSDAKVAVTVRHRGLCWREAPVRAVSEFNRIPVLSWGTSVTRFGAGCVHRDGSGCLVDYQAVAPSPCRLLLLRNSVPLRGRGLQVLGLPLVRPPRHFVPPPRSDYLPLLTASVAHPSSGCTVREPER